MANCRDAYLPTRQGGLLQSIRLCLMIGDIMRLITVQLVNASSFGTDKQMWKFKTNTGMLPTNDSDFESYQEFRPCSNLLTFCTNIYAMVCGCGFEALWRLVTNFFKERL